MIGNLLYFAASRPDIIFSVCLCARFQAQFKKSHLVAIKRILRYVKETLNLGLWYPMGLVLISLAFRTITLLSGKLIRKV